MAEHTESGELLVVYQALYGSFQVYARPLSMFFDEVDREKYPDAAAKQRFTLIPEAGSVTGCSMNGHDGTESAWWERKEKEAAKESVKEAEAVPSPGARQQESERQESGQQDPAQETFALDPRLLAFLEADSYEKKLEIYASLEGKADESLLNTIAVSLDLELSGDTLEEQYDTLKNCLLMLERYECNRLR